MKWYTGRILTEALDHVKEPSRSAAADKPLRIPICSAEWIGGIGKVAVGRVATGTLRPGMTVTLAPGGPTAEVTSIERHDKQLTEAEPGDLIGFALKGLSRGDLRRRARGMVCGDVKNDPPQTVAAFTAQVIVMDHPNVIRAGYEQVFHFHTASVSCKFNRLIHTIDKRTGQCKEEDPRELKNGDAAVIECIPRKPLCIEPFADYPHLGRFAIRDLCKSVAVGVVRSVQCIDKDGNITAKGRKGEGTDFGFD
jgi:elongation factor 1-alpha